MKDIVEGNSILEFMFIYLFNEIRVEFIDFLIFRVCLYLRVILKVENV